jgi:hypothetical protein
MLECGVMNVEIQRERNLHDRIEIIYFHGLCIEIVFVFSRTLSPYGLYGRE